MAVTHAARCGPRDGTTPGLRMLGAVALAVAAAACAPPASQPPEQPAPPPPVLPPPRPTAGEPLAVSADVIVLGRISDPGAALGQLGGWSVGAASIEVTLRSRLAATTVPVDLSKPFEWLVVAAPEAAELPRLRWAVSLALRSSPGQSTALGPVASPLGLHCEQRLALGSASHRVICSPSRQALQQTLPIALRAAPLAQLPANDVAVRFFPLPLPPEGRRARAQRIAEHLARRLGLETRNQAIDQALAQFSTLLEAEAESLQQDLRGALLRAALSAPDGNERFLDVALDVPALAPHSLTLRSLLGEGADGLAPQEFWNFPIGAQSAGFSWASQPRQWASLRGPFARLVAGIFAFRGLPKRLQIRASHLVETFPLPPAPTAWAEGPWPASARGVESWLTGSGWKMASFGAGLSEIRYYVRKLVESYRDPIIGPQWGRLLRASFGRRATPVSLHQRDLGGGVPRGSFELEIRFPPQPPDAARNFPTLFVLFTPQPDDGFTMAWGADHRALVELLQPRSRVSALQTLAGRPGLGLLHRQRVYRGGFTSWLSLAHTPARDWLGDCNCDGGLGALLARLPPRRVTEAPNGGLSPVIYLASAAPSGVSVFARLSQTVVQDLVYLLGGT